MKLKRAIFSAVILTFILVLTGCSKEFTVSFDCDGGTVIENQSIKKNQLVTQPENPEKEGYRFLFWEQDGIEFDFESKVTKDLTLVAKYEEKSDVTYTIKFNTNGGNKINSQIVEENQKLENVDIPVRDGYKFLYWELNGKEYNLDELITKNITLIAKWEKETVNVNKPVSGSKNKTTTTTTTKATTTTTKVVQYNVTFNSNGGNNISSTTVRKDNTVNKPVDPTRSGYTFLGWYLNNNLYNFNNKVNKNITLLAKWEKVITYSIDWKKVENSSVGQYTLHIKSSEGKYVTGIAEITTQSGKVESVNVPTNGVMYIKDAITKATVKSVN